MSLPVGKMDAKDALFSFSLTIESSLSLSGALMLIDRFPHNALYDFPHFVPS